MKKVFLLGWDAGPWMCSRKSKDALVLFSWDGKRLELESRIYWGNLLNDLPQIERIPVVRSRKQSFPGDRFARGSQYYGDVA